jgi:hypothetical protein
LFGAPLRKNLTDVCGELLDEFCNHFTRHPKTAGKTKTGGAFSPSKKVSPTMREKKPPPMAYLKRKRGHSSDFLPE